MARGGEDYGEPVPYTSIESKHARTPFAQDSCWYAAFGFSASFFFSEIALLLSHSRSPFGLKHVPVIIHMLPGLRFICCCSSLREAPLRPTYALGIIFHFIFVIFVVVVFSLFLLADARFTWIGICTG